MPKGRYVPKLLPRKRFLHAPHYAASRIQRRFRKYRASKFTKKVARAALSRDPVQYRLYGVDREPASQNPAVLMNISNIKANNGDTNPMYVRTAQKIKPINLNLRFRVDSQDAPFNQVCIALIRSKRSTPVTDALLNAGNGPITNASDRPFLQLNDPTNYNTNVTNMTGLSNFAHPSMLLEFFNPKVVQVIKTWTVNVQPTTQTPNQNYPPFREWSYNHRFKGEIWKYPEMRPDTTVTDFPYNNMCYTLVYWSDSVAQTSHPAVTASARFSFKDLD